MKAILYIIGISLLLQEGYGQTTPDPVISGEEPATTPTPIPRCEDLIQEIDNKRVDSDVDDCDDGGYTPAVFNLTVLFESVEVGSSSVANVTCNSTCNDGNPIAVRRCESNGTWGFITFRKCSSNETNLNNSVVDTSDPNGLTPGVVNDAIDVIEDVAADENIDKKEADTAVEIINNLVQPTTAQDAQDTVEDNEERILTAVDNIQKNVPLVNSGTDYAQYTAEQASLAIAVIGEFITRSRAITDQAYYYTPAQNSPNLVDADFSIIAGPTTVPTKMYIMATPSASKGDRISFQIYSGVEGILSTEGEQDIVSGDVIFAANGTALESFTMNFEIKDNTATDGDLVRAKVYNSTQWEDASDVCDTGSVSESYGTVTCRKAGLYILTSVPEGTTAEGTTAEATTTTAPVTEPESTGLSGGAIAGIVVGSVAAVAIIVGIIIYCCKYKGKNAVGDP